MANVAHDILFKLISETHDADLGGYNWYYSESPAVQAALRYFKELREQKVEPVETGEAGA